MENVVVIDADRVLNPEGLRWNDEFVRHKALDAVGDLSLLGGPLLGRFEGRCAGHGINNALVRAVLARPGFLALAHLRRAFGAGRLTRAPAGGPQLRHDVCAGFGVV